ncbi:SAM50-like protein CG7639 [Drosophila novamexicana]|uniref:SAM50-like protein CG7639 n=1 Tax=Drosophila novamexicana TaxID=47314 RepID=UPI0011E5FDF3|nr:SAM50-like protein CG7639 [Drosophila novamexicana]XP_030568458.1 SAM50-like protein CG7639 [Drosophila novamexicana]
MSKSPNGGSSPKDPNSKYDLSKINARVDRVNVSGLLRTHNDYVMRAAEGLFKANNFQQLMLEAMAAKSYLHELGIFKDVSVHIDISRGADATPQGYEVTLKGKEYTRIMGSAGTEIGQNEGSLRTELTIPNILGRGESISLQGSYSSTRANDLQLKFWKPFFHTRFRENRPEISFSIFRQTDRYDISSFQTTNLGYLLDFSAHTMLGVDLTHSLQYENSIRDVGLLNKSVPFAIRDHSGPKLASLLRYSLIFDNRDASVFPTRGFLLKSVNEYCGLGGNIAYTSSTAHGEMNVPLFAGLVAQFCARVGVLKETKKTTVLPINNLFYCGGPLTLRGFKYGGAGPVIDGTPIGAQTFWCTGAHLWTPLPFAGVFKGLASHFRLHFFYNMGNSNSFTTDNMRSAFGLGLAVKLAERARIELNYCVPVRRQSTDKVLNGFQFGIGYEFV